MINDYIISIISTEVEYAVGAELGETGPLPFQPVRPICGVFPTFFGIIT